MTRYKSAFAVPSGFAVAARAAVAAKVGTTPDPLVAGKKTTIAPKRGRQSAVAQTAGRAA